MQRQEYSSKRGANWARENSLAHIIEKAEGVLLETKKKVKKIPLMKITINDSYSVKKKYLISENDVIGTYKDMESFTHISDVIWLNRLTVWKAQIENFEKFKNEKTHFTEKEIKKIQNFIKLNYHNNYYKHK